MTKKPQPFDLEDLKEIIPDDECNPYIRDHYWIPEIKQRIEEACEFYSRYKDKPELLIKEHPEYEYEVENFVHKKPEHEIIEFTKTDWYYIDKEEYNDWLFKLAFKLKEKGKCHTPKKREDC